LERLELGQADERDRMLHLLGRSVPLPLLVDGPLAEAVHSPGWTAGQRARLLLLLSYAEGDDGLDAARPFLSSSQPALQAAAAQVIAAHSPDPAEVLELLLSGRATSSAAVDALGRNPNGGVIDGLIDYLRAEGGASVSPIAYALDSPGPLSRKARETMVSLLPTARGEVRDIFLRRLALLPHSDKWLEAIWETGSVEDRRLLASTWAFSQKPPEGMLIRALSDPDAWVRALAIQGVSDAGKVLQVIRQRQEPQFVETAAWLRLADLGKVPGKKALACPLDRKLPLGRRLGAIQFWPLRAQGCSYHPDDLLRRSPDPLVRLFAARALRRQGAADPALLACRVYEEDSRVAEACAGSRPAEASLSGSELPTELRRLVDREGQPRRGVPYARWSAGGRMTLGITDRRGVIAGPGSDDGAVLLDPRMAF
ncbi:MAG: hypothetical protein ACK2U9_00620, partial [Anaerolineae bacterium]